jgi:hypothetical protein
MSTKVQFVTGLLSAMLFPALTWLFFDVFFKNSALFNKPGLPYLSSIAINLFFVRYFVRKDKMPAAYGAMVITFVVTILVFMFKLKA